MEATQELITDLVTKVFEQLSGKIQPRLRPAKMASSILWIKPLSLLWKPRRS